MIVTGDAAGRRVAFLPRHGRDHRFPPHKIPYRANLWALRSLGVRQVLAPSAVGSLTLAYEPGTLAIPDQLVDRTRSRQQTYYDADRAVHVPFADPYCPVGRAQAIAAGRAAGWAPVESGTIVVIEGPRFSTRAESQWYAAQGWTLVGMTGHPEAVLARELALCYATLALVTDADAGVAEGEGVTQEEVFAEFGGTSGGCVTWFLPSSPHCPNSATAPARTRWTASPSRSSCPDVAWLSRGRRARCGPAAADGRAGRTRAPR